MEPKENPHAFSRKITFVNKRPHIYIISSSEKEEPPGGLKASTRGQAAGDVGHEQTGLRASFFGHHIGKLLAPETAVAEEFLSIDKEIESSLEAVRKKLMSVRPQRPLGSEKISKEEIKHQRFIEERNAAQEALFEEIIRYHHEFGTGLNPDDLWSLHDLMKMEADHEAACSAEGSIHELVECDLLVFLRRKAAEQAWKQLEAYIERVRIPFPMPPSMEDPTEPARTERVREERKKSAEDDFLKLPAQQLAELVLGNVPNWVYSYPQKETYLWELTVLQGLAAGLAANLLMKYLSVWEENSARILKKIEQQFTDKIDEMRQQGESAATLPEILSVSKGLQQISREQIPDQIWNYLCSKLESS